jgi:AraC family transcriptional regulator of adaptative response/methylated-DNA-[protein]-cysteine methyltransferase
MNERKHLSLDQHATPLGNMIIISDEQSLYALQFADNPSLPSKLLQLQKRIKADISHGITGISTLIKKELTLYFKKELEQFTTPIAYHGTDFCLKVWQTLHKLPRSHYSYAQLALAAGFPGSYRAVARANALNPLAIIIPCHRIINSNGTLGGYNGGIDRKQWLLEHESTPKSLLRL